MNRRKTSNSAYMIATAIMAVLYGVMFMLYPRCADDIWYACGSVGQEGSWQYLTSTVATCLDHWTFDTGRMSNMAAAPFLGFLPKWVYSLLTAGVIWWIYVAGPKIAGFSPLSVKGAAWVLVVTFVFPWMEFMFTVIYSINYLWSTALAMAVVFLFGHRDGSRNAPVFVLALLAGWWHEGLSAPLVAGMVTYLAIRRRRPTRRELAVVLGLCAGISIIFLMPAFSNQMEVRSSNLVKSVWWETVVNALAYNFIYYIYAITFCITILSHSRRQQLCAHGRRGLAVGMAVFVFGTIGTAIYFRYYNGARTGAFNQLFCTLGLLYILRCTPLSRLKPSMAVKAAVAGGAVVLTYASLVSAIIVQVKLTAEYEEVCRLHAKGGGTVFFDQTPVMVGPDFLKPSYLLLNTKYGLRGVELFPTALKDFSPDSPEAVTASDEKILLFRNRIILAGEAPEGRPDIILTSTDGRREHSRARFREFTIGDGSKWTYIVPHIQTLNPDFHVADAALCNN